MPESVTQKEGGEYPSGIRYDPIFESVRPGGGTTFEMPAAGEASAMTHLPRRPFPTFNPEDYYANSDEFKNLLWRAGQFGLDSLPPDQQGQIKAARNHYPQVDGYLASIEAEKAEKEAQKLGGPKGEGEIAEFDPWDSRASALTHIQGLALIDKSIGEEAKTFKDRIDKFNQGQAKDKENSWKYSMGVSMMGMFESLTNNLKELAWYAAQGQTDTKQMAGEKPEEETTMQFLASLARENNDRAQNTVSGLIQFAPYMVPGAGQALFASDVARHPEIILDLIKLTGESYENLYKAATGDPAAKERLRQQPIETTFGLVQPFLLIFGIRGSKVGDLPMKLKDLNKVVDGITKDGEYPEFKDSFTQLMEIVQKRTEEPGEKGQTEAFENVLNRRIGEQKERPTEAPAMVETPDAQIKAIKEAPAGQLMTEAMQVQDVYSAKDLVDLYSLDKAHVEYLVSAGKTGKEPPAPADIARLMKEKKQREADIEAGKPKTVYAYVNGKLVETTPEPPAMPETVAPNKMIKGDRVIKRAEQMEIPVSENPKRIAKIEVEPVAEPAVETKAVKVQKEKIAQIEKDISEREKWITDLEGSKDVNAQSFALSAKLQVAERQVLLEDAKKNLEEIKKLPEEPEVIPPEETPGVPRETIPVSEPIKEVSADLSDAFKKAGEEVGARFDGMQEQAGGKPAVGSFTVKGKDRETTFYAKSPDKVKAEYDRKMAEYEAAEKALGKPVATSEPKPTLPVKEEVETPAVKLDEAAKGKTSDTEAREVVEKLNELNDKAEKAKTPEEKASYEGEINKAKDKIREIMRDQGDMFSSYELGFFGTPEAYRQLAETVYKGIQGTSQFASDIIARNQYDPRVKEGMRASLDASLEHHRNIRDVDILAEMMDNTFKQAVKDEKRRPIVVKAAEMGPSSPYWKELSTFEEGIATWLRKESQRLEQFVKDKDIMDLVPRDNPDQAYIFHWVKNPKTGKPYSANYGKFAKSGPQFRQRKFGTIEELENSGMQMATYNGGRLLGEAWKSVVRAHETREMVRNLNEIEAGADIMIPLKTGEDRPAGMIETWKEIADNGLEGYYTRLNDQRDILSRPVYLKNGRIIQGKVGVLNELHPYIQSYIENPTYGKIAKATFVAKALKLFGLFHPITLVKNDLMMGRNPLRDLVKGRRYIEGNDPVMVNLRRNGLNVSGYQDLGVDLKGMLKFEGPNFVSKAGDVFMAPFRGMQYLIFEQIHPRLKAAYAYDTFIKEWPRLQAKGLSKDIAAREVVRMADQLFSGEDYKMALLESSRFAAKYYYSATWRKAWQVSMLSPTWQVEHIRMFTNQVKSTLPESLRNQINSKTPKPFQLMRDFNGTAISNKYRQSVAGALAMYSAYNMLNWLATKKMDGEGKFMAENEKGKRLAVRCFWNTDDGTPVYFAPMKSIMEVPSALTAIYEGDWPKFTSKLNPLISATAEQFFNADGMGNAKYDEYNKPGPLKTARDWAIDVYTPITIQNFLKSINVYNDIMGQRRGNQPAIGAVVSMMGFPVSQGHPGGEWGKKIDDFKIEMQKSRDDNLRNVDNAIKDGNVMGALMLMAEMGMSEDGMEGRLMKHENRLLYQWENLSGMQKSMFLNNLSDEQREKFLSKLINSGK